MSYIVHFPLFCAGITLLERYPQDISEFTSQIEAFLLNKNQDTLNLALLGPLEQVLMKEHQKV